MTKVDFYAPITDLFGKPIKDLDEKELTVRSIVIDSMMGASKHDKGPQNSVTKLKKFDLGMRAFKAKEGEEVEIDSKEIEFILEQAGYFYIPLVVGRLDQILNNKED